MIMQQQTPPGLAAGHGSGLPGRPVGNDDAEDEDVDDDDDDDDSKATIKVSCMSVVKMLNLAYPNQGRQLAWTPLPPVHG